jgi:hypothetical protein
MLPVALGYVVVVTSTLYLFQAVLGWGSARAVLLGLGGVSAVLLLLLLFVVDRGLLVKGAGPRRLERPLITGRLRPANMRGGG